MSVYLHIKKNYLCAFFFNIWHTDTEIFTCLHLHAGCGGTGNIMCSDCGGRGHVGVA